MTSSSLISLGLPILTAIALSLVLSLLVLMPVAARKTANRAVDAPEQEEAQSRRRRIDRWVAGIAALLFAAIAWTTLAGSETTWLDTTVASLARQWQNAVAMTAFGWLTRLADLQTLVALTLVVVTCLAALNRRRIAMAYFLIVLVTQALGWAAKFAFARERPDITTEVVVNSPAFPSLHSAGAVSAYVALAWLLTREIRRPAHQYLVLTAFSALSLLIAWSRIYVGVHFATDVVAGLLMGLFVIALVDGWHRSALSPAPARTPAHPPGSHA